MASVGTNQQINRFTTAADLPEYLTPSEFCEHVGLSRSVTYDLLRRGEIPHRRFGRRIFIPKLTLTVSGSSVE